MGEFNKFKEAMQAQFESMLDGQDQLFLTDIGKDVIWEMYLDNFPEGTNQIYKKRREFDCSACRQFLRPFGNVVAIKDNKLVSIWDIEGLEYPFNIVAANLSLLVKSAPVINVFVPEFAKLGVDKNRELLEDEKVRTWEHLYFKLPVRFVNKSHKSMESIQNDLRTTKEVFMRSMNELTIDAAQTIIELIDQKSLYKGDAFKDVVQMFIDYKLTYLNIPDSQMDNWCWKYSAHNSAAKIRNSAIGTLLIDLSAGVELDDAVRKFEALVAPSNYKRPKAIFTKRMVEDAERKIEELGFSESLGRKFATLEDGSITVNNVLFVNRDVKKKLGGSIFDDLKESIPESIKKFDKVEEIGIEDFVKDVLPTVTNLELMPEGKHMGNLMSLIAPQNKDAPSMLKWGNNFSWAHNGDLADCMRQNVKNAGGNVEGVLRFSIQWNDELDNPNDFDAHCIEPDGNEIYYNNKNAYNTTGELDVDIIDPGNKVAVENITWTDKNAMLPGRYKLFVRNYSHNGGTNGFTAEIEYDGQTYSYSYPKELRQTEDVLVAEIKFDPGNGIEFIKSLDSSVSSKAMWGINTNKFSKVSVAMFSPNYWDDQKGVGDRRYFFFLEGCKNESNPRGFFNEFLNNDLMEHKRVFEAMGSKMRVEQSDQQLSGLGFSSTQRNSIVAKVEGSFSRVIKINF